MSAVLSPTKGLTTTFMYVIALTKKDFAFFPHLLLEVFGDNVILTCLTKYTG